MLFKKNICQKDAKTASDVILWSKGKITEMSGNWQGQLQKRKILFVIAFHCDLRKRSI